MKTLQETWKSLVQFLQSHNLLGIRLDDLLLKGLYSLALIITIVWMMPSERPFEYSNLKVNSVAPEEIIAPFKFAIQKTDEELLQERESARLATPPVFDKNADRENAQKITLSRFFIELQAFFGKYELAAAESDLQLSQAAPIDSFLENFNLKYNVRLTADHLYQLNDIYQQKNLAGFATTLSGGLAQVYSQGILDREKKDIPENELVIAQDGLEEKIALIEVLEVQEAKAAIDEILRERYTGNDLILASAEHLTYAFLSPNLVYNETVTNERKDKAVHDVPLTRGYVEQDERIIDNNEKVTEQVYQKLYSLSIAQKERSARQRGWQQFKFLSGKFLFAFLMILFTVFYIYFYRQSIFNNNSLLGMVTIIFLLQLGLAGIIQNFTDWPYETIPIVVAPMLLAMLLGFGLAFISVVSISLILGSVLGNDYTFTVMALIVGSVAVFSVQKIRNRNQMFRSIAFIMFAYFDIHLIFGLLHYEPLKQILLDFFYYLLPTTILAPTVAFFLVGIFEKLFGQTTDITLLELSDLNHPLIKDLSVKAPGSFNHSITVANLAEAAAIAIGANALLTRVGSYFHDIGKMLKPEYFVENQMGGINKHDQLTPHMSCLILVNHVKEGVKLADKHNLPKAVKQFISEHHGTSLIKYFYHKALTLNEGQEVNEIDFRYPGPRPQSKETAICMLADTIEAASRAMSNPTPQRIRNLVDTLTENKLKEGQLDNCDLTLKEINLIKEAFIPILTGIYHARIEYPELDKDKKAARDKGGNNTKSSQQRKKGDDAEKSNAQNGSGAPTKNEAADKTETTTPSGNGESEPTASDSESSDKSSAADKDPYSTGK